MTGMEKTIDYDGIGAVVIRSTPRIKRYSLTITRGMVYANMPEGGNEAKLMAFVGENRVRILRALEKHPKQALLDDTKPLQTATFRLEICRADCDGYVAERMGKLMRIYCPKDTCFTSHDVQTALRKLLADELRREAQRLLPARLEMLAKRHNMSYTKVKIRDPKTRWGSCNRDKVINLSISLMLLPWHLIDYVLLHELCHTEVMNHGEVFRNLLSVLTNGRAAALRMELGNYHTLR